MRCSLLNIRDSERQCDVSLASAAQQETRFSPFIFATALQREGTPMGETLFNLAYGKAVLLRRQPCQFILGATTKKNCTL